MDQRHHPAAQSNHKPNHRTIPIVAIETPAATQALYQYTPKIYPRNVKGYFNQWRWAMVWLTQLIFYGTPWLTVGDRQAVLLDISAHKFYIFELVIYPQDLIYLALLLIICALALFLFTAVAGRLWCGFSCPQSVYTAIFLWFERMIEGDSMARQKLDSHGLNAQKASKKLAKHTVWIAFSLITGATFIGYFTPIRDLFQHIMQYQLSPWEQFWLLFYSAATYGNAGFLREQVCKHMCPYARFQSAMFDDHTLIVTYDQSRGEPRGHRAKNTLPQQQSLGDCIDCQICVQVCPTGIDIRNGLQYACISCGLCIDACDSVMEKMQYPTGLIKFSTDNLQSIGQPTPKLASTLFRPKVLGYIALLFVFSAMFAYSLYIKPSFKIDITRDRGIMHRQIDDTHVQNVYQLHLTNATEKTAQFALSVEGLAGLSVLQPPTITLPAAGEIVLPFSLELTGENPTMGTRPIKIVVTKLAEQAPVKPALIQHAPITREQIKQASIFFVPAR